MDGTTIGKSGKVFLTGIDDNKNLITAYPRLTAITILGRHLDVAERILQVSRQIGKGFTYHARIIADSLSVNILAPETALSILPDIGSQRDIVDLGTLQEV